jgi:hypothetical protein
MRKSIKKINILKMQHNNIHKIINKLIILPNNQQKINKYHKKMNK